LSAPFGFDYLRHAFFWIVDSAVIRKILDAVGLATDSPTPRPSGLYETDFSEATAA